ncbi:MAG: hypothetical protein M0Q15_00165 [Nevskia sp.]|jgi:hypothetical protein|nr:hypothetical protein [Nevskia sp.]
MISSWVLVEGVETNSEPLRALSLGNALQQVVGSIAGSGTVLHVAAESGEDLNRALLDFARVQGVTAVRLLAAKC